MPRLLLPPSLDGDHDEVRTTWRVEVRTAVRSGRWPTPGLTDATQLPGLITLAPAPLLRGERHVHAFVPAAVLVTLVERGKVSRGVEDSLFTEMLQHAWSVLGLLAPGQQLLVVPPERHVHLVDALIRHWEELVAVGPRYTVGAREGADLWSLPTGMRYVLGQLGVPSERLTEPLPKKGIAGLLDST